MKLIYYLTIAALLFIECFINVTGATNEKASDLKLENSKQNDL